MGFSLKSLTNTVAKVAGGALGYTLGGPVGAVMGVNGTNSILGAVGLSDDQLQSSENLKNQKALAAYNAQQQNLLNEAAFQRNLQQWDMENAYNSPEQQMARYAAAGLNPNMIYSQSNTSAASPTFQASHYDTGEYQPVDKRIQREQLALAQMEHYQLIENQAIQNELARQRLVLAERDADRKDAYVKSLIDARKKNLTDTSRSDTDKDEYNKLRNKKLAQQLEEPFNSGWAKDLYNASKKAVEKGVSYVAESHRKFRNINKQFERHVTGSGKGYVTYGRRVR